MKKHTPGSTPMSALRPYMIEAIHKWISDNKMTPLVAVDITIPDSGLIAPISFAVEDVLLLDLAHDAADDLVFGPVISAQCYFDKGPSQVLIPVSSILAIYSRETKQGLFFEFEEDDEHEQLLEEEQKFFDALASQKQSVPSAGSARSRAHLRLVKSPTELKDESVE